MTSKISSFSGLGTGKRIIKRPDESGGFQCFWKRNGGGKRRLRRSRMRLNCSTNIWILRIQGDGCPIVHHLQTFESSGFRGLVIPSVWSTNIWILRIRGDGCPIVHHLQTFESSGFRGGWAILRNHFMFSDWALLYQTVAGSNPCAVTLRINRKTQSFSQKHKAGVSLRPRASCQMR